MQQVLFPSYEAFAFWVFTVLSAGVGSYLAAYLKKKGENIATREDLNQLVEQVKKTTEATRAIEERIGHQFSHKVRVWEMKKEALYETLTTLADLDEALLIISSAVKVAAANNRVTALSVAEKASGLNNEKASGLERWSNASHAYSGVYAKASVVCGALTMKAISEAYIGLVKVHLDVHAGNFDEYLSGGGPAARNAMALVLKRVREELDVSEHSVYADTT